MDEPAVIPKTGREKFIAETAISLGAIPKQKYLKEGLLEVAFYCSMTGLVLRKYIFDKDEGEDVHTFLQEDYEGGKLKCRSTANTQEVFYKDGTSEKLLFDGSRTIKQTLKNGYYAADGKPAMEIIDGNIILEQVWYEAIRTPGEPVSYGKIHRRPVKRDGKWTYEPARIVVDPSSGRRKEFRYLAGELQDTPDGSPAFCERDSQKTYHEVHVVQGALHGCPAIRGSLENGTCYQVNADNGVISDIPDVPGITLQKDKIQMNVRFNAEGQVHSRETVIDLSDMPVQSVDECEHLVAMVQDIMRSHLLQKQKLQANIEPVFRDPFSTEE